KRNNRYRHRSTGEAASASAAVFRPRHFLALVIKVPSGPLAKEMQKACQMENQRGTGQTRKELPFCWKNLPMRWANGESTPLLLQLI
ncbi:hypothetical protein, partial [Rhizobium sp. Pop5]